MSAWFRKEFPSCNYTEEFNMFEKLFMSMLAPKEMLMISNGDIDPAHGVVVYMSLPSENLETYFRGFKKVPESELPEVATLLIGDQVDFEKHFRFPRR